MIPLVTSLISGFVNSKVGQSKIPGFNQTNGELFTSKTNGLASVVIGYAITVLTGEPDWVDRIISNGILVYAAFQVFKRDTGFKVKPEE